MWNALKMYLDYLYYYTLICLRTNILKQGEICNRAFQRKNPFAEFANILEEKPYVFVYC